MGFVNPKSYSNFKYFVLFQNNFIFCLISFIVFLFMKFFFGFFLLCFTKFLDYFRFTLFLFNMESSKVLRKLLKAFNLEMLDLSSKLKTGYRYENHSWNPGFTNGVRQFCGYQYFSYEILFYSLSLYSPFLLNLINQNQVSFNDTLLNFGLCGFIKRSSTSRLHITQFHWPTVDKHTFQLFYYIYIYTDVWG